ncbi:MAG: DNA polymerase III subunit gamma/tau [Desulfobacterales bacterium]|nr:MAG: DNA polymerase III subunit gamma/tau [Desulfobacterales bacterium]
MSYLVLARKYRPQAFEQVVEQDHITRTLSNAISADRVAHAVLFSGPRGTGKTTVARILAKAMNCEEGPTPKPCNICRSCTEITAGHAVDVHEIDGASNNSVDQVRELRENIKYMPAHSLYKIYIIDEVHMLSTPAFNALLKTLEEPPSHIMFIFATTEPHKIPITILSRCQRHDFKRINLEAVSSHLGFICNQEDFALAQESLGLIAREAGGSMRDAISLLDQVMSCSKESITHEQLLDILGVIDRKFLFDLSDSILRGDFTTALDILDDIYERGHDLKKLYADLLDHFRNLLVVKMGKKIGKLVDLPEHEIDLLVEQSKPVSVAVLNQIFDLLFRDESSIRLAVQPKLALEMSLIRMFQFKPALPIDDLIDKLDYLRQEIASNLQPSDGLTPEKEAEDIRLESERYGARNDQKRSFNTGRGFPEVRATLNVSTDVIQANLDDIWNTIYEHISQKNPSLAVNLTKCSLKNVSENRLEIEVVGNGFTINMVQREKNMAFLKRICTEYFGKEKQIFITTKIDPSEDNQKKNTKDTHLKQKALSHPLIADAIDIFNGKLIDVKIR